MRILIVGATGNIGRLTLGRALDAGHDVTAFGRSTGKIERSGPGLRVETGDVLEPADLDRAMPGQDVVVATFGAPLTRDTVLHQPSLCEDGTNKIVAAMRRHGVGRLVCMTVIGAGDSAGHGSFMFRNVIEPVLLGRIMKDRTAQEAVVRAAALPEWAVVRPTELSEGDAGEVRVIEDLEGEPEPTTITHDSVARFLVAATEDRSHDGRAIVITN